MTLKTYKLIQGAIAVVLAIVFSQSIILKNFVLPVVFLIAAIIVIILCRRRVKEIIEDERDRATGGKAAVLALKIYSLISVVIALSFYVMRDNDPSYALVAATLSYSTCLLMLLYSLAFKYHDKFKFSGKKIVYTFLFALVAALAVIFGMRLLSGENNWICQNGQWEKHGQPSSPAPQTACK